MISEQEIFACHACGKPTHIDLLDAKPGTAAAVDPAAENWERFECWECYGEGYAVHGNALDVTSVQMKVTMRARA